VLYQAIVELKTEKRMSERDIGKELNVSKTKVHNYLINWKIKTPVN
jgi:orotate phosphoribosyltransferase-like protein